MQELLKITILDHGSELYWNVIYYLALVEKGHQIYMSLPNEVEKIQFSNEKRLQNIMFLTCVRFYPKT